jgi:hypothetical protein
MLALGRFGSATGSTDLARTNYSFEKRQRELAKKKKQEEKRQRKAARSVTTAEPAKDQDAAPPAETQAGKGTD